MRVDLHGRRALVCASSEGLGHAIALALAHAGATVLMNGRRPDVLAAAAEAVRRDTGTTVLEAAGDVGTVEGRTAMLAAMPDPDILIANTGGPPLGDLAEWDEACWHDALGDLLVAPIMMVRAVIGGMRTRGFGRVLAITSVAVRMPMPDRGLTNAAKSGLTGFLAGLSRQVAVDGITVNTVQPGFFATRRGEESISQRAARTGRDASEFRAELLSRIPSRRLGQPAEIGALCCFLCSPQAAYITGQSLLVDGGLFPGG